MNSFFKIVFSFFLIALIIAFSAAIFESFLTSKIIEIKITNIEHITDENGNTKYFIHTKDEVFRNENNAYQGKSNQEALMKMFEKNKTYKVNVVGFKLGFEIPFFISKFRNIIKIVQ